MKFFFRAATLLFPIFLQYFDSQVPDQLLTATGQEFLRLSTQQDLDKRRDAMAAKVEEIRGIKFKTPLAIRAGTRREYAAFALENARAVYGEDLAAAEMGLKAMGLVPPRMRLDLAVTMFAGLSTKAWCTKGEIILLDPQAGDDWLVNKMDLGLVDQNYAPRVAATYDAQMAWSALRMGDAEIVKHLFWFGNKLPDGHAKKLAGEAAAWEKGESKLASAVAPRLFVRSGDFAWRRGAALVAALHAEGGWARINRAFSAPPVSTEQALHPEKYAAGEKPVEIDLAAADAFLKGKGYAPVHRTVLGELGAALVLETHFSREDLAAASEGWGGDAFAVYTKEGAPALVLWVTAWDREEDAVEFHAWAAKIPAARTIRRKGVVALAMNLPGDLEAPLFEEACK